MALLRTGDLYIEWGGCSVPCNGVGNVRHQKKIGKTNSQHIAFIEKVVVVGQDFNMIGNTH